MLLSPRRLRRLTWEELDSLRAGHATRTQRALVGPRRVAWYVYQLAPAEGGPQSEQEFMPLPLIDAPKPAPGTDAASRSLRERLAEENTRTLAAMAAATPAP